MAARTITKLLFKKANTASLHAKRMKLEKSYYKAEDKMRLYRDEAVKMRSAVQKGVYVPKKVQSYIEGKARKHTAKLAQIQKRVSAAHAKERKWQNHNVEGTRKAVRKARLALDRGRMSPALYNKHIARHKEAVAERSDAIGFHRARREARGPAKPQSAAARRISKSWSDINYPGFGTQTGKFKGIPGSSLLPDKSTMDYMRASGALD